MSKMTYIKLNDHIEGEPFGAEWTEKTEDGSQLRFIFLSAQRCIILHEPGASYNCNPFEIDYAFIAGKWHFYGSAGFEGLTAPIEPLVALAKKRMAELVALYRNGLSRVLSETSHNKLSARRDSLAAALAKTEAQLRELEEEGCGAVVIGSEIIADAQHAS